LIELLVSMAVLSVLVWLLSTLMGQASKAWSRGEKQVLTYDVGRSCLEELQRDTASSIADDILPFKIKNLYAVDEDTQTVVQSGFGTSGLYVGTNDMVRMISAMAPRTSGREDNDLLDVVYYIMIDVDQRGRLLRRASNLIDNFGKPPPVDGAAEYITGSLSTESSLWQQSVLTDPDEDTEVIVENVYAFEVIAYDEDLNPIVDYYSKSMGNQGPARLDYRLIVLTDAQWARKGTFSDVVDWHQYALRNGRRFLTSAALITRGR
jgi:type II secretory pathway pseudopilin PulG